jgi:hypothetical protein
VLWVLTRPSRSAATATSPPRCSGAVSAKTSTSVLKIYHCCRHGSARASDQSLRGLIESADFFRRDCVGEMIAEIGAHIIDHDSASNDEVQQLFPQKNRLRWQPNVLPYVTLLAVTLHGFMVTSKACSAS